MALETSTDTMASLSEKLRLDDPRVPPRSWDSLPSQTGVPSRTSSHSSRALYTTSAVSEPSLVRLAMNALQGVESALISIEKLSSLLCYSSADRTSHRIPSLWTWCCSTSAVGNLFTSIGQFGCIVFLLHKFANYFTSSDFDELRHLEENRNSDSCEEGKCPGHKRTLINQAFAICVRKVLDGYISALNTLAASVSLRRLSKTNDGGCLTSIGHSEITLFEVYLHTTGLRTHIEALGNVCNVNHLTISFPVSTLEDLKIKADSEFRAFPRGAALLSFLYSQLKVSDPDHCALLKFLFLQSYEPYCGFIRSWIYDGRICDPYHEFVVEYVNELASSNTGIASPLPTIRVRDGVFVPCFLEECLIPLFRTGQQLQVIMKLLELCNNIGTYNAHEEILPCLIGLSSEYPWFAFPLTFDKGTIETMVLARATYYQQMQEKIDNKLTKFEFSSRQGRPQDQFSNRELQHNYGHQATTPGVSLRVLNNLGRDLNYQPSSVANYRISPVTGGRNQNMPDNTVDSEVLSIMDDYSYAEDLLESSECSSSETSEGQNEAEQLIHAPRSKEPSYLDALDFCSSLFPDNTMQNLYQKKISCPVEDVPFKMDETSGYASHPFHKETCLLGSEPKSSQTPETQTPSGVHSLWLFDCHHVDRGFDENTWLPSHGRGLELSTGNYELLNTDSDLSKDASNVNASNKYQHLRGNCASSHTFSLQLWKLKYDSAFFSMNPTQNRSYFLNLRTMHGERCRAKYGDPYFDFTSVRDPLKEYADKLSSHPRPKFGTKLSVIAEAPATCIDTNNHHNIDDHSDVILGNNAKSRKFSLPLLKKGSNKEHLLLPNISGGSAWESLLGSFGNIAARSPRDHKTRLVAAVEMPLDFVVKKCLLDEILLQYQYLSKLTIKFLIEGYKLQEHLVALRRYHFMELADWADLFILSLWHCKWHVNEADKRISEIQGFLALSVQRSSCEGDPNKDRLYVYLKEEGVAHLSASTIGIHSFDFLGLGYRVNWPISIILTPTALKIYSEIFNFLIQVKLAVFSLSDAWFSLKSYRVEQHKGEVHHVSILTETRHKINHFVSTLQQYVQSQLSQVSWCRFLDSLKNKVEDMLDLESRHMLYLTESLRICFLSNETQSIASIIQKILQCAMDFRSCLTGSIWEARSSDEKLSNRFSQIDILQVHSIRRTFTKNLEELHLIYRQSPKHGEFGISHFWDYLNYNEYYSEAMSKQMGHSIF